MKLLVSYFQIWRNTCATRFSLDRHFLRPTELRWSSRTTQSPGLGKLHDDLRDHGETCSENRVARLARLDGIAAQIGYRRRPGQYGGKPAVVADNAPYQQSEVGAPDVVWGETLFAIGSSPMARAVAESYFQLSKRERPRRRTCLTRDAARQVTGHVRIHRDVPQPKTQAHQQRHAVARLLRIQTAKT